MFVGRLYGPMRVTVCDDLKEILRKVQVLPMLADRASPERIILLMCCNDIAGELEGIITRTKSGCSDFEKKIIADREGGCNATENEIEDSKNTSE